MPINLGQTETEAKDEQDLTCSLLRLRPMEYHIYLSMYTKRIVPRTLTLIDPIQAIKLTQFRKFNKPRTCAGYNCLEFNLQFVSLAMDSTSAAVAIPARPFPPSPSSSPVRTPQSKLRFRQRQLKERREENGYQVKRKS